MRVADSPLSITGQLVWLRPTPHSAPRGPKTHSTPVLGPSRKRKPSPEGVSPCWALELAPGGQSLSHGARLLLTARAGTGPGAEHPIAPLLVLPP